MHRDDLLLRSDKSFRKVVIAIILVRLIAVVIYDQFQVELTAPDGIMYAASAMVRADVDIMKCRIKNRELLRFYFTITDDTRQSIYTYKRLAFGSPMQSEAHFWVWIMEWIFRLFGFNTLLVRLLNVFFSISSALMLYQVFRCRWALVACLILPTQIIYSMSMGRDMMRVFVICLALWIFYLGSNKAKSTDSSSLG